MTTSSETPQHAAGRRLLTWIDEHAWKDTVSVGVGIDAKGDACLHLYVQKPRHMGFRPKADELPTTWEGWAVEIHHVGPMVAQGA